MESKLLLQCLVVGCAGFVGAVLRFLILLVSFRFLGQGFPYGTLIVNVSGTLLLGLFIGLLGDRLVVSETTRFAIAIGLLGSYTTFSTFAYESHVLLDLGDGWKALANLLGSLILGLIAIRVGLWLGGQ